MALRSSRDQLAFLEKQNCACLFDAVVPLTSCTPIDLYLILEPFTHPTDYLVPHHLVEEWWNSSRNADFGSGGSSAVCGKLAGWLDNQQHAHGGIYDAGKRREMLKEINTSRGKLIQSVCGNFKACVEEVHEEYRGLMTKAQSIGFYPQPI